MEKNVKNTLPETRVSEEIYIENGIAVFRKVKEVITSRDTEEAVRPIDEIKEDYFLCCHKQQMPIFNTQNYGAVYYTDIMKGEEILDRILTEDEDFLKTEIDVAIVKEDGRIEFEKACFSPLYRSVNFNIRPERDYRFSCMHIMPRDIYSFNIFKTNSKYFAKHMRSY